MSKIGVLALQGGFAAHARRFAELGVPAEEVRWPRQLAALDGLVIPGGESTTLLHLMDRDPDWWPALQTFHQRGGAIFGTCAGTILLAKKVHNPEQRSLGLLDVDVDRNAYGRQVDSSEGVGSWATRAGADERPLEMVFIRAPRITRVGDGVEILARRGDDPVLVEEGAILAATFHPELTADDGVHRLFLERVASRRVPK